jgi:hypothetical protein
MTQGFLLDIYVIGLHTLATSIVCMREVMEYNGFVVTFFASRKHDQCIRSNTLNIYTLIVGVCSPTSLRMDDIQPVLPVIEFSPSYQANY